MEKKVVDQISYLICFEDRSLDSAIWSVKDQIAEVRKISQEGDVIYPLVRFKDGSVLKAESSDVVDPHPGIILMISPDGENEWRGLCASYGFAYEYDGEPYGEVWEPESYKDMILSLWVIYEDYSEEKSS